MITGQKLKRSFFFSLSVSLLLLFLGSGISFLLKRQNEASRITSRLNREILAAEKSLESELQKISTRFEAGSVYDRGRFENEYRNHFEPEGTIFLIYRDQKLYAWSDISFQAPLTLDTEFSAQSFLAGSNGYYLKSELKQGHWTYVGLQLVKYHYKFSNAYLPEGFFGKFHAPPTASVSIKPSRYNVISAREKFLFSISYEDEIKPGIYMLFLVFMLYVTGLLWLVSALMSAYIYVYRIFRI